MDDAPMVTSGATCATEGNIDPDGGDTNGDVGAATLRVLKVDGDVGGGNERGALGVPAASDQALALLDRIEAALDGYDDLGAAQDALDHLVALKLLLRRDARAASAAHRLAVVRVRVQRRAGEILLPLEANKGGGDHRLPRGTGAPTLKDLGVDKKSSSLWKRLARLEQGHFEAVLAKLAAADSKVNAQTVLAAAGTSSPSKTRGSTSRAPRRTVTVEAAAVEASDEAEAAASARDEAPCGKRAAKHETKVSAGDEVGGAMQVGADAPDAAVSRRGEAAVAINEPDEAEAPPISAVAASRSRRSRRGKVELVREQIRGLREGLLELEVPEMQLVLRDLEALAAAVRERVQDWSDGGAEGDEGAELQEALDADGAEGAVGA